MQRYLVLEKLIELGSFTKTAQALGYTQSAVSQMIAALESELGVRLVQRGRGGVQLTADGNKLWPWIERTLAQYRVLQSKVNEVQGLEEGVIRIGTISSVTRAWLPDIIQQFEQLYPKVKFVFHQGDYTLNAAGIKNGEVDFGIVTPQSAPELTTIPLRKVRMLVVLPREHRLAGLKTVPLTQLQGEQYIMVEQGDYSEPLEAMHEEGVRPKLKFTIHDDYSIMAMVEKGLGFSVMSELILDRMPFRVQALPSDPPIYMDLALGFKDREAMPIASQRFVAFLLAKMGVGEKRDE